MKTKKRLHGKESVSPDKKPKPIEESKPVYIRLPMNILKVVDAAVKKGDYMNRSEALRAGARLLFRLDENGNLIEGQKSMPVGPIQ